MVKSAACGREEQRQAPKPDLSSCAVPPRGQKGILVPFRLISIPARCLDWSLSHSLFLNYSFSTQNHYHTISHYALLLNHSPVLQAGVSHHLLQKVTGRTPRGQKPHSLSSGIHTILPPGTSTEPDSMKEVTPCWSFISLNK